MIESIDKDSIHLWLLNIDKHFQLNNILSEMGILSTEEKAKFERIVFLEDKIRFLLTRVLIRNVLSFYEKQIPPKGWVFKKNIYGKPYIANQSSKLKFNISHSNKTVVVGVSERNELGVDVEELDRKIDFNSMSKKVFSTSEYCHFISSKKEDQPEIFYRFWTLKEAYAKALGKGVSIPFKDLSFFPISKPQNMYLMSDSSEKELVSSFSFWQERRNGSLISIAQSCEEYNKVLNVEILTANSFPPFKAE
jgi:4'-phosphopantetheinyl transferase